MRSKAKRALMRFTDAAVASLKEDDDELMQGGSAVVSQLGVRAQPFVGAGVGCSFAGISDAPPPFPVATAGANWDAVVQYVDMSHALSKFDLPMPSLGQGTASSAAKKHLGLDDQANFGGWLT